MIRVLITILLVGLLQVDAPAPSATLLQQFMQDVVDDKLNEPALAEKYMCPSLMHRTGKNGEQARTLFHMTLMAYREDLRKQQIDPKALVIVPFDALTNNALEITGDTKQVYVAQYKGETFCHFLMQDGKIASLNLLHKGKRGFFISYCE